MAQSEHEPAHAPEVRFRRVEKGAATDRDVSRMLELFATAFAPWPAVETTATPAEHLRWKMASPGALFGAFLGEASDQLVSTETVLGYRMLLRGREAVRMQFVDTAVHPDWRGRGVASASLALRQRTVAPLYDLSIIDAQSAIMIQRASRFGTRPLGNAIHPLLLPLHPREVAERWALDRGLSPRWARALAGPLGLLLRAGSLARVRSPQRTSPPLFTVAAVDCFDSRIDRFSAAASAAWDALVIRSREHLDWRYDARAGNFLLRVAEDATGEILGYAVANRRGARGHLVDLLALPERLDVVAALVVAIDRELASAGCSDVLCWLPRRHPYREVLHRAGWFDTRAKPFITYRATGAPEAELEFLAAPDTRVHFTLGDTDLV